MEDCYDHQGELTGEQNSLPQEIMHEILSRIPVKPLCRFKCVSKPWLSLISNPRFIEKHSKAIENKDVFFQRRRLVFTNMHRHFYSLDLDQLLNQNIEVQENSVYADKENKDGLVAVATELDFIYDNFPGIDDWFPFCQNSNSLLLSQSYYAHYLINPVAKKSKKIPKPPRWRAPWKPYFWELYGFGFDYSTNEYKVVNGQFYGDGGIVFSVYKLETDSWRQIDGNFPYRPRSRDGIAINGAVHWLLRTTADHSSLILSINLADEEVREVPLPVICTADSIELGVFRDWLCITWVSSLESEETYNEFWVMKEYGVRESWTKMRVSIPYHRLLHSGFSRGSYDLLVFDTSYLIMYNFSDDKFWTLSISDNIDKISTFTSMGIYVESLSSLIYQDHERSEEDETT